MSSERSELPFKSLGSRLKTIRQKLQESVAEVSGAVEIDENALKRIEQGQERPSEDILLLLISHFGMQDDEAASLWQLAGYDPPRHDHDHDFPEDLKNDRNVVLVMAVDPRIVYTDGVQAQANQNGVVLQFIQGFGTPRQLTTARVGMSREQARTVLRTLQDTLERSEPRQLPPTTSSESKQPHGDSNERPDTK
jgi:transcriptional regulator with XRE-family HTH domain